MLVPLSLTTTNHQGGRGERMLKNERSPAIRKREAWGGFEHTGRLMCRTGKHSLAPDIHSHTHTPLSNICHVVPVG